MIYVANAHSVSVINPVNDTEMVRIPVEFPKSIFVDYIDAHKIVDYYHAYGSHFLTKIYLSNGNNTVSVINGSSNKKIKDISVGGGSGSGLMTSAGDGKLYVANNDSVSVINLRNDTNEQNITLGFRSRGIEGDIYSHKNLRS